jgi:GR25 family glycosyltransferase involved in LPS biosynthesis
MPNIPVLFLIFNRPEYTRESLAAIRNAKPKKLYIAADGPRQGRDGEKELCEKTRNLVLNSIDWECEVKTRFQEKNLGCYLGVSTAISWFFDNEEMGIILEDDVVANLSFFSFCEELLEKYRDEKKIWAISGYNVVNKIDNIESFYICKMFICWGWATWADRWKPYSLDIANYDRASLSNLDDELARMYFLEILINMQSNSPIDSWAYRYMFRGIENNALHITSSKSLCKNIGSYGTHFQNTVNYMHNLPTSEIQKIIYPKNIESNKKMQQLFYEYILTSPFCEICKTPKKRDLFLWGTGGDAIKALRKVKYNGDKITAFVDTNKAMQGEVFNGYNIISPNELFGKKLGSYFVVIASTKYAGEIAMELERNDLVRDRDYWRIKE